MFQAGDYNYTKRKSHDIKIDEQQEENINNENQEESVEVDKNKLKPDFNDKKNDQVHEKLVKTTNTSQKPKVTKMRKSKRIQKLIQQNKLKIFQMDKKVKLKPTNSKFKKEKISKKQRLMEDNFKTEILREVKKQNLFNRRKKRIKNLWNDNMKKLSRMFTKYENIKIKLYNKFPCVYKRVFCLDLHKREYMILQCQTTLTRKGQRISLFELYTLYVMLKKCEKDDLNKEQMYTLLSTYFGRSANSLKCRILSKVTTFTNQEKSVIFNEIV